MIGELGVDDTVADKQCHDLNQGTNQFGGAGTVKIDFFVDGGFKGCLDATVENIEVFGVAEVGGSVERHVDGSCVGLVGCLTFLIYQILGPATLGEKNKRKLLKEKILKEKIY